MAIIDSTRYIMLAVLFMSTGFSLVTASGIPAMENNTILSGSPFFDMDMQKPVRSPDGNLTEFFSLLQTVILSETIQGDPVTIPAGEGWQDIVMPARITRSGHYRVIHDYTTIQERIGILVTCSDVSIDGNGHTFMSPPGFESYGIVAAPESLMLADNTYLSNITISNFQTRNCTGGIVFYDVHNGKISDTHHRDAFCGIAIDMSRNLQIEQNTVTGNQADYPDQERFGIAGVKITDTLIESNEISGLSPSEDENSAGIMFVSSRDLEISGNLIEGPVFNGVSLSDCSDSEILGNQVTKETKNGIFLLNTINSEIAENIISEVFSGIITGYDDDSDGGNLTITKNHIFSLESLGVSVNGGLGIITTNDVKNTGDGIIVKADGSLVTNNTIHYNSNRGLSIIGRDMTISGNTLTNNGCNFFIAGDDPGYYLHQIDRTNLINGKPLVYLRDGDGIRIGPEDDPAMVLVANSRNVTVHDIATGLNSAGVLLVLVTNATISGVTDRGSAAGMGALWSEGCVISDSSSINNSEDGFFLLYGSDSYLNRCFVTGVQGVGYDIVYSEDTRMQSCSVSNFNPVPPSEDDQYGILVSGSKRTAIQNSTVLGSMRSGISVMNSDEVSVTGSMITGNHEYGITCMQSSQVSVHNSVISDNERFGIGFDFLSDFILSRNTIQGNTESGLLFLDAYSGLITDNLFNNTKNVDFVYKSSPLSWNTTLRKGTNIVHGPSLGGNFWAAPDGSGFSQTHKDRGDGICNATYVIDSQNTDYLPLAVPGLLTAAFEATPLFGTPPLEIKFTDTSAGSPVSWDWNFGDGTRSFEEDPVHTYQGIGWYTVTLIVTDESGRQEGVRKPVYVDVNAGDEPSMNGIIMVTSTPTNSSVFLDGNYKGQTPCMAFNLNPGVYRILITHDGYRDWSGTGEVIANQCTYVPEVVLTPQ